MATTTITTIIVFALSWVSPLQFLLYCLPSFVVVILPGAAEGTYSNTMLYPVTEEARAARGGQQLRQDSSPTSTNVDGTNKNSNSNESEKKFAVPKRQPGAPSRYLEYEGPDATYSIRVGTHPNISYPHLDTFPDTQIQMFYQHNIFDPRKKFGTSKTGVLLTNDCPRHFLWLSDRAVQKEADHYLIHGRWTERTLVEKAYFTLFYGGTGLASQYMDSVDDFQTDLKGWDIMNRSSNHCEWEGIECRNRTTSKNGNQNINNDGTKRKIDYGSPNATSVVGFQINGFSLEGTLPDDLYHLTALRKLDLHGNQIKGGIPASYGKLRNLTDVDLGSNRLTGELPSSLKGWKNLKNVRLRHNQLRGPISKELLEGWAIQDYRNQKRRGKDRKNPFIGLKKIDLSENRFGGIFPMKTLLHHASDLEYLNLAGNRFQGTLPDDVIEDDKNLHSHLQMALTTLNQKHVEAEEIDAAIKARCYIYDDNNELQIGQDQCILEALVELAIAAEKSRSNEGKESVNKRLSRRQTYAGFHRLEEFDIARNRFSGSLPLEWWKLPSLKTVDMANNRLTGSLPTELLIGSKLEYADLSHNRLTGTIPIGSKNGRKWSDLPDLKILLLDHNQIEGTIPYEFLRGLAPDLEELDMGSNNLSGTLPSSIAEIIKLETLDLHGNRLTGTLPAEMNRMYPDVQLNITDNLITGTVPKIFCGGGAMSEHLLFRQFGCDAILCPAGTFHPEGAASLSSGCRPCPVKRGDDPMSTKILGQRTCGEDNNRTTFVNGDLNGDGILSEREILRLLYTYTIGSNWGLQFENWAESTVKACDLNGVVCVDGKVAKLDLTDATMCATKDKKQPLECLGLPAELFKLTNLEILTMNRRQFLQGTLPTEIGEMTNIKYLDISSCPLMTGALPTEIGRLTNLKYFNIGGCRFNGTIPEELFKLTKVEKLHLSMNAFTGTVPSALENMTNLKELLLSRTYVNNTIPEGIGKLVALENFEMYGNRLSGSIPNSLGKCTNLKRIDLFNNKLTGTIPESLTDIKALQILHIKLNHLTGTISSGFGRLPSLSWFDVSTNHLHGTIPESFGHSKTLKDFRLGGGNMIHNHVPKSLCTNTNINGGLTKTYGCSGVICPLGTYSDPGHATHSDGCKPCPHGRTTIYLGSSRCIELTDDDILTMFYDVMAAYNTFPMQEKHWGFDREGPVCGWNGVECDENNSIETIWFPLLELNADI